VRKLVSHSKIPTFLNKTQIICHAKAQSAQSIKYAEKKNQLIFFFALSATLRENFFFADIVTNFRYQNMFYFL